MKKIINGPFHIKNHIVLEDTEQDRLNTRSRKRLNSKCGFNQKGYDIFLEDSYISIRDIKELNNWNEYESKIKKNSQYLTNN